jgi:hypothetical protein
VINLKKYTERGFSMWNQIEKIINEVIDNILYTIIDEVVINIDHSDPLTLVILYVLSYICSNINMTITHLNCYYSEFELLTIEKHFDKYRINLLKIIYKGPGMNVGTYPSQFVRQSTIFYIKSNIPDKKYYNTKHEKYVLHIKNLKRMGEWED